MPEEPISIICTLKNIIYFRDNFLISNFAYEEKRGLFTAKGHMDQPEPGLAYKLRGNWVTDPKYGKQFKFMWYEVMQPRDTEGIYKYIVRVCKWVGPTVASRIVEKYGDKTLEVLKESPSKVSLQIQGLTKERAKDIQEALLEYEEIESVVVDLEKIFAPIEGIPRNLAFECASRWGANAVVRLRENPYLLTLIKGIGFLSADKVALSLGIDKKARSRQQACIVHLLGEHRHEGHLWMSEELLIQGVTAFVGLCEKETIDSMLQFYVIFQRDGHYALHQDDINETYVAEMLVKIMNKPFNRRQNMADIGDDAQSRANFFLELELEKSRSALAADPVLLDICCEDCGEEIPEKRREAVPGCTRCVKCQEEAERWAEI